MISLLLALLMLASFASGLALNAAAETAPVVYTAADNAYFNRSKQDVIDRYRAMLAVGPAYDNDNERTWYDRMYSAVAPYDQGVLKQDTLDAMMAMTNYVRWLSGTEPLPTDIHNSDDLQRGALIRGFDFGHFVDYDSSWKPADMDQDFWNSGCSVYHNILCGGSSPRDSVVRWLNEGYYHDNFDNYITFDGIGHRMAILGSDRASIHYGYADDVAIGYYGIGGAAWDGAFAAFPCPGAMPKELLMASSAAWSVEPNKDVFSFEESKLTVTVNNLRTGECYVCTAKDETLYGDQGAVAFMQPMTINGWLVSYPDDSWSVTVSGLTDRETGKPAQIQYVVDLFSMESYLTELPDTVLSGSCGEDVTWSLDTKTRVLTVSGTGAIKNYYYDESRPWHEYRSWIRSVVIEDGVTGVGRNAFCSCHNLIEVRMADSVKEIGFAAFSACRGLRDLELSSGLTRIGIIAFCSTDLTELDLPYGLTAVEDRAFYGCDKLLEVTVPSSVTEIGEQAFGYHNGRTNIERYPGFTLCGCDGSAAQTYAAEYGIPFVTVPDDTPAPAEPAPADGLVTDTYGNIIWTFDPATKTLTFTGAGDTGFWNKGERPWAEYAAQTERLILNEGITEIGRNSFMDFSAITEVEFPDSVTLLDSGAFSGCVSLKSIRIGSGLSEIGVFPFVGCEALTELYVAENNPNLCTKDGVIYTKDGKTLLQTLPGLEGACVVASGTQTIRERAFQGCTHITKVTLPDSLRTIGLQAFSTCPSLETDLFGDGPESIGIAAFWQCTALREVRLPDSLKQIGSGAFAGCARLEQVELPKALERIEAMAFYGCDAMRSVTAPNATVVLEEQSFGYDNDGNPIDGFTICGVSGSTAQTYAAENDFAFVALSEVNFTDVPANAWYAGAVAWAAANDITRGVSATAFCPDDVCTRAQVVTFLWRAAGMPEPTTTENPFKDVKEGAYYYKAVLWAVENKVTAGTSATTFSPDATCTRAQIVTFLWHYEHNPEPMTTDNPFNDVKPGTFYEKAVLWASETGVTAGTSATTFSPDATCTRAQVVTFLYRASASPF